MPWADQVFAPTLPATASKGINDDKEGNALTTNNYISRLMSFIREFQIASPYPDIIQPLVQGPFPSSTSHTLTTTDSAGQNVPSALNNYQPTFPIVTHVDHDNQQGFDGVKEPDQTIAQRFGAGAFNFPAEAANAQATGVGQWTQQTSHDAHQGIYGAPEVVYDVRQAFNNAQAQAMYGNHLQQTFRYFLENIGTNLNTAMQTAGDAPQLKVDLRQFLQNAMQAVDNMPQSVTEALPAAIFPPSHPRPNQTLYKSGEHNCYPCILGFASKNGLEKHEGTAKHDKRMRLLNPDAESHVQKVLCVYCEGRFANACTLSRHQKSQHRESA